MSPVLGSLLLRGSMQSFQSLHVIGVPFLKYIEANFFSLDYEVYYHLQSSEAFCFSFVFLSFFLSFFFELYLYLWPVVSLDGQLLLISFHAAICHSSGRENSFSFQKGEELPERGCTIKQILVEKHYSAPLWPQQPLLLLFNHFLSPCGRL